jgi:hypothetical protein
MCPQKPSHAVLDEAIGVVACLAFVVACCFSAGVCRGVLFLAWHVWWRVVSLEKWQANM